MDLASVKRVGDLQAFSIDEACLEFGPADSYVILRPWPGYMPKVPTREKVVKLQGSPALALLCPVHALSFYVDCTQSFKISEQLFVCYEDQQKGKAVSR